ncbi:response regulator transcription factor [Sulfurospirillum sp. hDNRA2]|uniref:response regulator transcription factor n=1 Tax=Sulfurospirillum sp. hDNRA2 TaxID=3237298 RepID=UPI0020B826E6|nr:response regulator [Sulfurospirillum sp. DNRA8]MCP3651662.1 response regulator [Sulfurospirillum sp. DNRA8]MCR1810509.1 response regulator [Sulfurospirillum sp. DNRA8]
MLDNQKLVLKNSSILLAEDEENLRNSFKKVLLLYVKEVFTAANGEEAFEIYQNHRPDIVITDVKMPKLNGLELIKKIRKENQETPIIVTSAYTDKDLLLESIKLSLVDYLVKPIKEKDLIALLEISADVLLQKVKTVVAIDERNAYDYQNKQLIQDAQKISLTHKEVEFLEILLQHKGNLVTRQTLEDKLYVYEEAPPSALKNLVFKLRKKIGNDVVQTVGNLGYTIKN